MAVTSFVQNQSFNPKQLGTSTLLAWYRADSYVGSDGDAVGTWSDSSGNGRDMTQGTAGYKPLYKTNIRNGRPVMRFDGTDDYLAASTQFQPVANKATVFYVLMQTSVASTTIWSNTTTGNGSGNTFINNGGTQAIRIYRGGNYYDTNTGVGANTWAYYTTILRSSSTLTGTATLRINGSTISTSSSFGTGNSPNLNMQIGTGPASWFNGDIAEILFCDGELTSLMYIQVETYLKKKYGL